MEKKKNVLVNAEEDDKLVELKVTKHSHYHSHYLSHYHSHYHLMYY